MPIYDYACAACGHRCEVIHGGHGEGPAACPVCGGPVRKAVVAPSFVLKGSGWAKVDRRVKAGAVKASDSGDESSKTAGDGGSDKDGSASKDKDGSASKDKDSSKDKEPAKPAAASTSDSGSTPASTATD
jgi:putative FmdB family regulatory protein